MKIYVLGNEFLEEDSLAKKTVDSINSENSNIEFIKINSFEEINLENNEIILMDVIKNLDEVKIFNNFQEFKKTKIISAHDLDISFYLNLLQEVGQLEKIKIIGIPPRENFEKIKNQLVKKLSELKI